MNKKVLISYYTKIIPDDNQRENMLDTILSSRNDEVIPMKRSAKKLSFAAVAVIIICILTATTAIALSLGWHEKLIEYLSATNEQIDMLTPAINLPEAELTQNGVTVTVKQTLADSMGVYVIYEITAPEGIEFTEDTTFSNSIFVVTSGPHKTPGSAGVFSAPEILEQHGNRRTMLQYFSSNDFIVNGSARLILDDFGYYKYSDFVTLAEGRWDLKWDFSYEDTSKTFDLNELININGNSYAVTRIIISPLSMCVFVEGAPVSDIGSIVITFKDGSELACDASLGFQSRTDADAGGFITQIFRRFGNLIDLDSVAYITIGGVKIPIDL